VYPKWAESGSVTRLCAPDGYRNGRCQTGVGVRHSERQSIWIVYPSRTIARNETGNQKLPHLDVRSERSRGDPETASDGGYQAPSCAHSATPASSSTMLNRCTSIQTVLSAVIRRYLFESRCSASSGRMYWEVAAVRKTAALTPHVPSPTERGVFFSSLGTRRPTRTGRKPSNGDVRACSCRSSHELNSIWILGKPTSGRRAR
jgi:hypothetical protein